MSNIERLTAQLEEQSYDYQPAQEVLEELGQKILIPLVGPTAVGKTTIMNHAEGLHPDFKRVRSFTFRECRLAENPETYDFRSNNEEEFERVLADVTARKLVQFTVHPTTRRVYGTYPDAYASPYCMLDMVPQGIEPVRGFFKETRIVGVGLKPKKWADRIARRIITESLGDIHSRLDEGINNIHWLLKSEVLWVDNSNDHAGVAARKLIEVVLGEAESDPQAKEHACALLVKMKEMQAHLNPRS